MQAVREVALFLVEPHALDWVELGRVRWQGHECDVRRYDERPRTVPSRLIEHHGDVLVAGYRPRELVEEQLHRLGIHIRQDQREGVVSSGLYRSEDIGESKALVGDAAWALAALPPHVTGPALLTTAPSSGNCLISSMTSIISALSGGTTSEPTDA